MKRYCLDREPNCTCLMCGDPEGSWVKYDEAKALQKELDELKASIKGMVKHAHECEDHFLGGYRDKKELDAFVHGMRVVAHCVEGYANQLEGRE